jgi:tetratricopeptide (TPR) repeat protein
MGVSAGDRGLRPRRDRPRAPWFRAVAHDRALAHRLLTILSVDRGVIAAATELFDGRHYPGVVAMCSDALIDEPDCLPLLLIRARAHIALRRHREAQADLRDLIRLDPRCGVAYRLLGELAARRDETESAATLFLEAFRLDPGDREAADWLMVVDRSPRTRSLPPVSFRPAAVANKLPAPATAAGRFPRAGTPDPLGESPESPIEQRFARGTRAPEPAEQDERPTRPFARGSVRDVASYQPRPFHVTPPSAVTVPVTVPGRPPTVDPARPAPRLTSRPAPRSSVPELPGFGDYLVETGILTRERLRAAQAYQRSMRVQLATAIVTLGLATPQRIEWAAVAHQSQLTRDR